MNDDEAVDAMAMPPDFGFPLVRDENGDLFVLKCSPEPPVMPEAEAMRADESSPTSWDLPLR